MNENKYLKDLAFKQNWNKKMDGFPISDSPFCEHIKLIDDNLHIVYKNQTIHKCSYVTDFKIREDNKK